MQLLKKIIYTGYIELETGLHIGGTNAALNIGGPDKFVVRNPLTNIPYIPGSSLKGKMRSLIELRDGTISKKKDKDGRIVAFNATNSPETRAGKLFGTSPEDNKDRTKRPSRLIVRDCPLNLVSDDPDDPDKEKNRFSNCDLPYTESKTEVAIDRVTAQANPRTFERVPAGAKFAINMVLNIFKSTGEKGVEDDNEDELRQTLKEAAELLQDDYLGGQGSRGYGQIKFVVDFDNPEVKTFA